MRVAVGAALVLLVAVAVLGPVLGLVGSAAAIGPVLDVPYAGITAGIVLGFLLALGGLAGTFGTRRAGLGWALVVLAVLCALGASLWPLLATADAAVDRGRDVLPWITGLVREFS